MDKQLQLRFSGRAIGTAVTSATCVVSGGLLLIVPGLNRVQLVANIGVQGTDSLMMIASITGVVLMGVAIATGAWATKQMRTEAATQRQAFEAEHYKLPSRNEKHSSEIEKHLKMVAVWHPDTEKLVERSLSHLVSMRQALETINEIFDANKGAFIHGDTMFEYGKYKPLLEQIIDEMSATLIGLIYEAYASRSAPPAKLKRLFERALDKHEERVAAANTLALTAARTINSGDSNPADASTQLHKLTELAEYATHWGNT